MKINNTLVVFILILTLFYSEGANAGFIKRLKKTVGQAVKAVGNVGKDIASIKKDIKNIIEKRDSINEDDEGESNEIAKILEQLKKTGTGQNAGLEPKVAEETIENKEQNLELKKNPADKPKNQNQTDQNAGGNATADYIEHNL